MFISSLVDGHFYLAERSRRSAQKLVWVKVPYAPIHNGVRIAAREVPRAIRRRAYKLFEGDRCDQRARG